MVRKQFNNMNFFRRYTLLIVFTIILVISFSFLIQNAVGNSYLYKVETLVTNVTKPIGWGLHKALSSVKNFYANYFQLIDIKKKYAKIELENKQLHARLYLYESIAQENQKLKSILDLKETNKFEFFVGKIIGYDPTFTFKSVKINLGRQDGIQIGMGAISPKGVIGVVIRVQQKTCDLLLITDPNSNLDSMITRNQSRGILQGKLENMMRFKYFDRNLNIWIGDKIVTSGFTGAFPPNIPIGTITNIQKNPDDLSQIVDVEPTENIVKLNEVIILKNTDPAIDTMHKIAGADWIEHLMTISSGQSDEK